MNKARQLLELTESLGVLKGKPNCILIFQEELFGDILKRDGELSSEEEKLIHSRLIDFLAKGHTKYNDTTLMDLYACKNEFRNLLVPKAQIVYIVEEVDRNQLFDDLSEIRTFEPAKLGGLPLYKLNTPYRYWNERDQRFSLWTTKLVEALRKLSKLKPTATTVPVLLEARVDDSFFLTAGLTNVIKKLSGNNDMSYEILSYNTRNRNVTAWMTTMGYQELKNTKR